MSADHARPSGALVAFATTAAWIWDIRGDGFLVVLTAAAGGLAVMLRYLLRTPRPRPLRAAAVHGAVAVAFAGAAVLLLNRLLVGQQVPNGLTHFGAFLAGVLGVPTATLTDVFAIRTTSEVVRVSFNWTTLPMAAVVAFLGTRLATDWAHGLLVPARRLLAAFAVGVALLVLRAVLGVFVFSELYGFFVSPSAVPWWDANTGVVSVATLLLVLWAVARVVGPPLSGSRVHAVVSWRLVPCAAAPLLMAVVALAAPTPSATSHGRVLVDDSHADDWELAGARFTPEWRGDMSVYACSAAFEHLGDWYSIGFNRTAPLDDSLLADIDVLVLKMPTRPYAAGEQAAIEAFVRRGGGLLAIGDHTDLFGSNSILNQIIAPAGMTLEASGVANVDGDQAGVSSGWGDPLIERGAEPLFWLTGCHVSVTSASPALVWRSAYADRAIFANGSYFGDGRAEPCEPLGPVVLAAAGRIGSGRVLAIGDGTIFTNFAAFRPGRFELLRNAVAYLNSRDTRWRYLPHLALAAACIAMFLVAYGSRPGWPRYVVLALLPVSISVAWIIDAQTTAACARVSAVRRHPQVTFLGMHAHYYLAPTIGVSSRPYSTSFDTLFVETLRYGWRPRFGRDLRSALAESDAVIIPNVFPTFTVPELDALKAYVQRGGILWLLSGEIPETVAGVRQVLGAFGRIDVTAADRTTLLSDASADSAGTTVIREGRGLLCVSTAAETLSRDGLGHPFPEPTAPRAPRFSFLGRLFELWLTHVGYDRASAFERHGA